MFIRLGWLGGVTKRFSHWKLYIWMNRINFLGFYVICFFLIFGCYSFSFHKNKTTIKVRNCFLCEHIYKSSGESNNYFPPLFGGMWGINSHPIFCIQQTFSKPFSKFSRNCFQKTWRSSWLLPSSPIPSWQLILGFVTCISHFCRFSSNRKGHVNRSRGQIYGQIAALDSFPQWQDLTVAKVSCY